MIQKSLIGIASLYMYSMQCQEEVHTFWQKGKVQLLVGCAGLKLHIDKISPWLQ